jgi:hypothetical protein
MKTRLSIFFLLLIFFIACKKESFITNPDARVNITEDSLHFDTVFTSTGSITQFFKVINENNQKLKISSIRLMGGSGSSFKINVDGNPGPDVNNLELAANDSLYVFVSVSINPNAANLPFVITDSIEINYNGTKQKVQLEAWGQNAHFFRNKKITGAETWSNDLPYVILGFLQVDTNAILTINKGCRIYMHADAPCLIEGSLLVNGEKDSIDRVYFRGDRLDDPYRNFPANWPGIFFRPSSKNNVLNFAIIRNAFQAIAVEEPSVNANPKITLNECIIDNAYDAGIIAVNSSITAKNCLVSNCGKNLLFVKGGDYQFTHCTIVSYSNFYILHKDPVLILANYININNIPVTANLNATFKNCIIWGENGTVENEIIVAKSGSTVFNVLFDHVLMKTMPSNSIDSQSLFNQPPLFDSINTSAQFYDFHLKPASPAIDYGINVGLIIDLDGKSRPVGLPDLGSYEFR